MSKPTVVWLYNNTANDGVNSGNASGGAGGSGSNWVVIDKTNDKLMFLDDQQTDGDLTTGNIYPVIIPAAGDQESDKTFVWDNSEGILDQVKLAGTTSGQQNGGNTRYVFAIYFDGTTSTIPYLEAWDDIGHDSYTSTFLGAGTPANSTVRAITTTNAVPGSATWSGTPLASTSSRISLDTGALAVGKNLYFNIKQILSSTFIAAEDSSLVLTLRYSYS
uniref:Uncharacterized protein n=1 Tax=viral metagenome TaxID=1070528 RepID=A0A6M3J6I0_9ZZZZ